VTRRDFLFIVQNDINAVRIPVGWSIAYDPDPSAPFIGGSLNAPDRAFYWAQ
jgi:aryl-phospho-beta-D-glucosidase BglC (GH1 family)